MTTVFGIKNCDSVKKARNWLSEHGLDYEFQDLRSESLDTNQLRQLIEQWIAQAGWEALLNRRGTTWRKLDKSIQDSTNSDNVTDLLIQHPAMIKRPILDHNGLITLGFKPELYQDIFNL